MICPNCGLSNLLEGDECRQCGYILGEHLAAKSLSQNERRFSCKYGHLWQFEPDRDGHIVTYPESKCMCGQVKYKDRGAHWKERYMDERYTVNR